MYGPSGSGKSSLVKAGLIPRLSADIKTVYVEATPGQTEAQLLHALRKHCPGLPTSLSLPELLIAIRKGQGRATGEKVLIVLDQFEQWLHGQHDPEDSELVHALRQCDGGQVQCLVLVRDDFWMAVTRFLRELEVTLVQGRNIAAVDLFPELHAQKVLAAFGRAFGTLSSDDGQLTGEQQEFIRLSVAGLAEDGKVVCVRLAMFAEMIKSRPWTLATLHAVGGTAGVGVAFLEETFTASSASPRHRYHQRAARGLLRSLLPDNRADLKGQWRSRSELLEASGYDNRVKDFDDLIQILDSDLRLITPTDPQGATDDDGTAPYCDASGSYYQLTHDYLVPSIRQWLEAGMLKSRAGRTQLMFTRQTRIWTETRRDRDLPSLRQYNRIRFYTRKSQWTPEQQQMMAAAWRYYMIVNCSLLCFLLFACVLFWSEIRWILMPSQYSLGKRDLKAMRGFLVKSVGPDGPLAEAGIRNSDLIIAVDGRFVQDTPDWLERFAQSDGSVEMMVVRREVTDGLEQAQIMRFTVELEPSESRWRDRYFKLIKPPRDL